MNVASVCKNKILLERDDDNITPSKVVPNWLDYWYSWCNVCCFFLLFRKNLKGLSKSFRSFDAILTCRFFEFTRKIHWFSAMITILFCLFCSHSVIIVVVVHFNIASSYTFIPAAVAAAPTPPTTAMYNFHLKLPIKYILLIWYVHPTVRLLTHFRQFLNEFQPREKKSTDDGKKNWK